MRAKHANELSLRVEAFLANFECGLRAGSNYAFEVYDLRQGQVVTDISDLVLFARANGIHAAGDRAARYR